MSTKDGHASLRKKSSFLDLFTKARVERARGAREAAPTPHPPVVELPVRRTSTLKKPPPPPSEPGLDTGRRKSLYPPSLKTSKSSKSLRSVRRPDEVSHARVEPLFEPPGLFKAYPQSVNYTTLEAPGSSHGNDDADSEVGDLEPLQEQESQNSTRRVFDRLKARRKTKVLAQQAAARNALAPAWSKKIYILVTSGYLLQYPGSGPFDRLPEKLLKLGPNSAAFASDAIEGKHWVLQVVQDAKDGHLGFGASKTFLNRVGLQGRGKAVSSMLLVFASAEDMDCWMMIIRKEIAALGGVAPSNPEVDAEDKPDLDKSTHRRYSGIIRRPSDRSSEEPLSPVAPTAEFSMVASPRTSSVTAVISPPRSSTRSSRAVASALLSPVHETQPQYTEDSIASAIGPQLTSPSFFEQQPSPSRSAFPQSPGQASFGSGSSKSNGPPGMLPQPVPSIPPQFVNLKSQTSRRRHSMQSNSSQTSSKTVDQEAAEQTQDLKQRYSSLNSHPVPVRLYQPNVDPPESEASSDAGGEASMTTWPAPPQPVRQGAFESMSRPSVTHTLSMEPISESPPATPGATLVCASSRPGRRPAPLKLTTSALDSNTYMRRSSLATPGEPQSPRTAPPIMPSQTSVAGKRASVFHKPLPLKVSPPASNRVSVQVSHSMSSTSTTASTTTTNSAPSPCASPSAQYFTPPSTAGMTPMPTAALVSPDSKDSEMPFPRPTSLLHQDTLSPPPPSSNGRTSSPSNRLSTLNNTAHSMSISKSATDLRSSTPAEAADRRTSTSVPIIRPPMRSSLLRSRASANALGRALQLPPNPNPPPSSPLPPPPPPSSPPPAVPVTAGVGVAGAA